MSARPTLSVRPPKTIDDFVAGRAKVVDIHQPSITETSAEDSATSSSPDAAPAAVSADAAVPVPHVSKTKAVKRPKMRGLVKRADGDERARVTVYLDLDDAAKLRRHCFENGLDLSEVAAGAIQTLVAHL